VHGTAKYVRVYYTFLKTKVGGHMICFTKKHIFGMKNGLKLLIFLLMTISLLATSCNQDDDDDDSSTSETTGTESENVNSTFPQNLVVASPTAASDDQIALTSPLSSSAAALKYKKQSPDNMAISYASSDDYSSKLETINAALNATEIADCAGAVPSFFDNSNEFAPCYGPMLEVTNMSDSTEDTSVGRSELGMYWEYSEPGATSGESCAASKVNSLFEVASRNMDFALGLHAMLVCAARITEAELPAVGTSSTITDVLDDIDLASMGITISAATIERLSDATSDSTSDTYAVYQTHFTGQLPIGTQATTTPTNEFEINVKNVPLNDDNTNNKGVLSFILYEVADSAYTFTKHQVSSISWETIDGALNYLYRKGEFVDVAENTSTSMLDSDGMTLLTSASPGSDPNTCEGVGWCNAYSVIIADYDSDMFGKVAYARFIGDDDSQAFTFNVNTDATTLKGTAYFGNAAAGVLTTDEQAVFDIIGINCVPRQSNSHQDYTQKQLIELDSSSGDWIPESGATAYISYVPTQTCSWDSTGDSGASFEVTQDSYSESLTFPVTHNLYDLSDYQSEWTTPDLPVIDY